MKSTLSQAPTRAHLSIGALASASNLPASTIRYWERIGLFPAPLRQGGQRRYNHEALSQLIILRLAQSCGFSLQEIRRLVQTFRGGTPSQRWRAMASSKRLEIDAQINELQSMRKILDTLLECECLDWKQCASLATQAKTETQP